ncbi:CLUMA_CG015636, isoform A [Clunio marinus]|uniref:CLUMA_CG015636, isoform A n=1 Tax=Clunio marinus TaxID=568069 RepID=A0A1J1IS18_9DIPT|nr:CLUMA_CG015636, isoform A [Clunio marinus]
MKENGRETLNKGNEEKNVLIEKFLFSNCKTISFETLFKNILLKFSQIVLLTLNINKSFACQNIIEPNHLPNCIVKITINITDMPCRQLIIIG